MAIQDHNLNMTEQQYRDLERPSYSMLASIDKQGVDVIKGDKVKLDLKFGSLVDVMCFEPHRVNELFYKGDTVKSPTTTHKKVVDDVLIKLSPKDNNAPFKRKHSFSLKSYKKDIIDSAKKFKVLTSYSDDKVVDTIVKSCGAYFKDKMKSFGKTLIKPQMWALALQTANTLQTHPFSAKYFNHKTPGIEIIYQYKFLTKVNGRETKGMLDCLIINHNAKVIIPVDLKTGELPVKDFPMLYTSHRYYIQGALYKESLKSIVNNDFELEGYVVNPFEFLYISKLNPNKPMIFVVDDSMHQAALNGFTDRFGYKYRGVHQLLEDYYGCIEEGYCDYTKAETLAKGRVLMDDIM